MYISIVDGRERHKNKSLKETTTTTNKTKKF